MIEPIGHGDFAITSKHFFFAGNAGGFWANLLHSITSKNTRSTQSAQVCIEALHTLLFTDRSVGEWPVHPQVT